jgi:hypothetical protein
LNALNGTWLAIFFLLDEMWALGRLARHYYLWKQQHAGASDPTAGNEPSDKEAGLTKMLHTEEEEEGTVNISKSTSHGSTNNSTGHEPSDEDASSTEIFHTDGPDDEEEVTAAPDSRKPLTVFLEDIPEELRELQDLQHDLDQAHE